MSGDPPGLGILVGYGHLPHPDDEQTSDLVESLSLAMGHFEERHSN